jgi:hypothetical protein
MIKFVIRASSVFRSFHLKHYTLLKWRLTWQRLNAFCGFRNLNLRLQCERHFLQRNRQHKCRFIISTNCLIRLAAFLMGGEKPRDDKSLKLRWYSPWDFRSQSARINQARCLTINMSHLTVHKILLKCLKFKSRKYQLLQHITA